MKKKSNSKFRHLARELTWNNIYIIIKTIIIPTDKMKYSTDPQTEYLSSKLFHILLFPFFMSRKCKKQNLYFYDAADSFLLS